MPRSVCSSVAVSRKRTASPQAAGAGLQQGVVSRRWRLAGVGVLALVVGAWVVGTYLEPRDFVFGQEVPARRGQPSVVLITLDTTRADRLGSYGYAAANTPNLDRLAALGARFNHAVSPAPLTLPAHATLMTGRNPYGHGVRNNGHFVLGTELPTLAARFAAAGYDTAAFVSAFVLDRQFGLARGFAHYDDALDPPSGPSGSLELERRGDRTVRAAGAWLAARPVGRPYFLWLHLYDAHDPYTPPASYRAQFEQQPYDGEVAFVDAMVGEMLAAADEATGQGGAPLVVVAGDHGESLGDHGESTHGLFVYEAAVRVPLIMTWPGAIQPRVVAPTVALADVAPTVAALTGLPPFESADGASLVPLLDGAADTPSTPSVYAETYFPQFFMGWAPLRMVRQGAWKYIDAPEPELYDLNADPGETSNLVTSQAATARRLRAALEAVGRQNDGRHSQTPISAEAHQKLTALGYVSAAPPAPVGPAADPKRMVGLFEQLLAGNRALARGDGVAAMRLAGTVLSADPGNGFARLLLGRGQLLAGQPRAALDALRAYLAVVPGSADAHHWMALAHLRLGDRVAALAEEEAALAIDPRHGAAIALRAGLLFSAGRKDEGLQALGHAVTTDPLNTTLRVSLADLLADAGRAGEAEPEYRRVLDTRPNDVAAHLGLGLLLARTDRLEPALVELTRVLELAPAEDEARYERGRIYERLGRTIEARTAYERLADPATRPDLRQAAAARLARLPR